MKFRVPEIFLGAFLTVAVFGMGMLYESSQYPRPPTSQVRPDHSGDKRANAEQNDGLWNWLTRDATGVFTLLLFLVASGQVYLFLVQLRLIRDSLTDAKIAADAAKESAKATRDSVDVAKFSTTARDRAYIYFNGCRWISHRQNDKSPVFWRIRPRWINGGNTPPRGLRIYAQYELLDAPLPLTYQFTPNELPQRPALVPPKGQIESHPHDFWGVDLVAVQEGTKYLYIWGTARYRDYSPDTSEHVTKFCVFAGSITGDPLVPWDEKANPMDIAFAFYDRHNCADEDCNEQG